MALKLKGNSYSPAALRELMRRIVRFGQARRDGIGNGANGLCSRREAVLYYTHFRSPAVLRELARLRDELGDRRDIFVIGYCRTASALDGIDGVPVRAYSPGDLRALPYPAKLQGFDPSNYLGMADLAPMKFFLERPHYDYYWIIEYDVRFSGSWAELFSDLSASGADLLCTTVQTFGENPGWAHWNTLVTAGEDVPMESRVKGFLPLCRASRALLAACDEHYRRGWSGHPEVLWATVASRAGLRLEDIGGDGGFTPAARRGRYYRNTPTDWSLFPGTFVFRPSFADRNLFGPRGDFQSTLWHPVKD